MLPVTADDEHADLMGCWQPMRVLLNRMPSLLHWLGDVEQLALREKADRVKSLGSHLEGAVMLIQAHNYGPVYALLRTCLEHAVVDWLVFQGRTFVQRISNVSEDTWAGWQRERSDGAEWTRMIRDWNRNRKGQVRIVREGLYSEPAEDGTRQQISIYYFLLEQYRPELGPPSQQVDDGLIGEDRLRRTAEENRALWEVYLTWSSLLINLRENRLVDEEDASRLGVHYRFLSGYAHPVADQRRTLYGKDAWQEWPRYDHYSSELALLYVLTIGIHELRNFVKSVGDETDVTLTELDQVEGTISNAEAATQHFWFLGDNPHEFDTWHAANVRLFRTYRGTGSPDISTESSVDKIAYPRDPLDRLVSMHSSAQELMTGLAYVSPWPRADARFR
jgi:hypothetical protein